ncbi:uncharacterized protein LOC119793286 [Cyprinodon tularosa]|uniref:uncharacterized protein LOC119793286 n=1 Tax=Cyprinodon tularosa TaxID=77115 RepID=UPI0018E21A69|nr:uncharacterized protein LOC119793286 [Cyprinodon tularosa]
MSMRRTWRNSRTLLQDLYDKAIPERDAYTHILSQSRDSKMIHPIASLVRAKNKMLLFENPDTVEIYKLNDPRKSEGGDLYLPAIPKKASSLNSLNRALSQSCPYLYEKRRGSFSSVTSQRTRVHTEKQQSSLKAQKEAKKANVTVTMTYLGQGQRRAHSRSIRDELKILQQINGGENLCVFKGLVSAGEQFQFVSQRHRGFPFSASLYVNGIMAARISSCCEYRYAPGFQQGRKSCFRLSWLAGGTPCYRCTSLRQKYSSCQQLNNGTKENLILPVELSTGSGPIESCPSSPLFIPVKPKKKSVKRPRKHFKERSGGSTDSEDAAFAGMKERSRRKERKGQSDQKESKGKTGLNNRGEEGQSGKGLERSTVTGKSEEQTEHKPNHSKTTQDATRLQKEQPPSQSIKTSKTADYLQDFKGMTKQKSEKQRSLESDGKTRDEGTLKDFYKECVEMSAELNQSPNKHWFKANILERYRFQRKLSSQGLKAQSSDLELSAESDTIPLPNGEPEEEEDSAGQDAAKVEAVPEQDLQAQLDAMMMVLSTSDEVEQLVLRNTELTDDLLFSLSGALISSQSEVTLLNLNLNLIGPYGAHILLDILRAKPQIQSLHMFGNKLRDHGVLTLLRGVAELQDQTATAAAAIQQALLFSSQLPGGWSSFRVFALLELDIGGNGLGSNGVKVLASYMRSHSYLQYLGLAQTNGVDLSAWKELFDSLKSNTSLTQIILDENNLGDPGVRLLADMLKENLSLQQVDLDRNVISDVGGNDIMAALLCRTQILTHLSLDENNISEGLMTRIQEQIQCK